jgi:hypothetical protein
LPALPPGVLEVELQDAVDLAAGDITGQSDPYCVVSVGDSAWTSSVQRFTRAPVWRQSARLFVRDASSASTGASLLRIRVMDADTLKEDDTLGVCAVPLPPLCDGARHTLQLPVQPGGGGPGGGTLRLAVRFRAFAPPPGGFGAGTAAASGGKAAAAAQLPLPLLPPALAAMLPAPAAWAAGALASAASAVGAVAAAARADAERKKAEAQLWAVPADDDWALLAASPSSAAALPSDFEKVVFVSQERTDTQVAVWRARTRRAIVVAFRGTETAKLTDIITDARLAPKAFNAERAGDGGDGGAAVHDGFLSAFDSVRPRVLAALDDARGAGARARAAGAAASPDDGWHVYVTGHSLGGALATLFAGELAGSVRSGARRGVSAVSMVNFGSPRVGNARFCDAYNALVPDSVRVVNGSDAIPTVPALLGYRHVAHGVRISPAGAAAREEPSPAVPAGAAGGLSAGIAQLAAAALSGGAGAVDAQAAADAALALASLVDAAALEAHFEDKYLSALRAALQLELTASTRGE